MPETQDLPGIREFADKVIDKAVQDGKISPTTDGPAKASLTPVFSKGTAALDEDTGRPVVPADQAVVPPFVDGHIPLPADVGAPPPPAAAPAPDTSVAQPPAAAAGAAAAETAAQAIVDEYDEFEFEDPDLQAKFKIKAPKQYIETAKRGYGRRVAYDRAISYLKAAEPTLRPLIEDGRMNRLIPLIQRALENQEFGEAVSGMYDRSLRGLPLVEQAKIEAAAAGAAPPQNGATTANFDVLQDPLYAPYAPVLAPILEQQKRLEAQLSQWQQAQTQRETQTAEQARQQAWIDGEYRGAHTDLDAMFPGHFNPNAGVSDPFWQRATAVAREGQYVQRYGYRAGMIFAGQQVMHMEQERLRATASPGALALQAADAQLMDTARREAANSAATVSGGAVAQSAMPQPPPKPGTRRADGTLKAQEEWAADMNAWLAQYGPAKRTA